MDRRQRGELVPLVAETGGDRALRAAAVAAARDWRRLPLATRAMVLWLAVRADPAVHDGLLAAFRDERDRVVRREPRRRGARRRAPRAPPTVASRA